MVGEIIDGIWYFFKGFYYGVKTGIDVCFCIYDEYDSD